MKTLHISTITILLLLGMIAITFTLPVLGQVEGGGPARPAHYQFSDMASVGNNVYVLYQQNSDNGANYHVFFRKSHDAGQSFGSIIRLDNTTGNSPLVAASGNNVYVTWLDSFPGYPPSKALFAKSMDGGETFAAPTVLDSDPSTSYVVTQLVADKSHVYAVIAGEGEKPPYNSGVYLRTSQDNGTTFGDKVELLQVSGNPLALDVSMQKIGDTIYVAGEDEISCSANPNVCNYDIFLRKSTDDGTTFGNMVNITTAVNPVDLHMYTANNNVYIVWDQLVGESVNLFLAKSNDGGSSFSTPEIIGQKSGESSSPHLMASGKDLYVIWKYDNANIVNNGIGFGPRPTSGIFLIQSHDGGNTISEPLDVSGPVGTSYWSNIAASGNNVFVSWGTKFGDKEDVFIRKSPDNGTIFDDAVKLTDEKQDYFQTQMVSSGNNVYVAIDTGLPGDDLFLATSHDGGDAFDSMVNLNHEISVPEFPFAVPILLTSFVSLIVFYRLKIRK
ncbi:MAG: exo-alpha-sialidase [Thaumarchaeota archaeon]|nr:exo-alpha-sialidase [Nitrososphaerota archaeon]